MDKPLCPGDVVRAYGVLGVVREIVLNVRTGKVLVRVVPSSLLGKVVDCNGFYAGLTDCKPE